MRVRCWVQQINPHLVDRHELLRCIRLIFVERNELDVFGRPRLVAERWTEGIQVMCANSDEYASSTQILV